MLRKVSDLNITKLKILSRKVSMPTSKSAKERMRKAVKDVDEITADVTVGTTPIIMFVFLSFCAVINGVGGTDRFDGITIMV